MMNYDVIVIGSGTGMNIVNEFILKDEKVALVDKGPAGGTCLNTGCVPSKLLLDAANRAQEIKESKKFGIHAQITKIDFKKIMSYTHKLTKPYHKEIHRNLKKSKDVDFYEGTGKFTDNYTLEINGKKIKGKKIFIVSGSRPKIPRIKGIQNTDYLTNETILDLNELPKSIIIIGGGYISAEYAHFFSALGSKVTIIQKNSRLLPNEDKEISNTLQDEYEKRMKIYTNTTTKEIIQNSPKEKIVICESKKTKKQIKLSAQQILIATGRESNADLLDVKKTSVETDNQGFIKVNNYLETTKKNIWAFGDAIGKAMFTHAANEEASLILHNLYSEHKIQFDFSNVPHAVFSWPEIASIGLSEIDARKQKKILVGKAKYSEITKGNAIREEKGFAKIILDKDSDEILGFHIIGPHASILIQEVNNAIATDKDIYSIVRGTHIHPALTELIQRTILNIK